jgi:subtilisin family serine protease
VIAVADESRGPAPAGVYRAPGRDVPTTIPGGRWGLVSGSSFAAAHVSGLIALVREKHAASAGLLKLVAAAPSNIVDACATLLGAAQTCAAARIREASAAGR